MRKTTLIFQICILMIISSCISNNGLKKLQFELNVKDDANIISKESLFMTYPYDMFVTDEIVGILGYSNQKWLHFYDKITGEYINSYIGLGRGPGEILSCSNIFYDSHTDILYIFDNNVEKLLVYELSDYKHELRLISEHKFDGIDDVVIYKVWPLSNATYLVNSQISSDKDLTRFQIYSREDELLDMNSEMPELTGDDNQAYIQSFITMSPNNQHLASVTLMGQILELYDLSDTTITRRLENIYNFPNVMYRDGVVRDTEKTIWGFPCITSDNTYIYASLIDSRDPNVFNHIAVFDWNGNGVLKLTTDYNVLRLAISGNDLYAIVANMDNELFLAKYAVNEMIAR